MFRLPSHEHWVVVVKLTHHLLRSAAGEAFDLKPSYTNLRFGDRDPGNAVLRLVCMRHLYMACERIEVVCKKTARHQTWRKCLLLRLACEDQAPTSVAQTKASPNAERVEDVEASWTYAGSNLSTMLARYGIKTCVWEAARIVPYRHGCCYMTLLKPRINNLNKPNALCNLSTGTIRRGEARSDDKFLSYEWSFLEVSTW